MIGGSGLPTAQLDNQIAASVGDPTTCVLIADAASGKVLYRYGDRLQLLARAAGLRRAGP